MSKELWIEEWTRLYDAKIEAGWSEADADRFACDHAQERVVDRFADMADRTKDEMKERGEWPPRLLSRDQPSGAHLMTPSTEVPLAEEGMRVEREPGPYWVRDFKDAPLQPAEWRTNGKWRFFDGGEMFGPAEVGPRILPPGQPTELERELTAALRDVVKYFDQRGDQLVGNKLRIALAKATERGL